MLVTVLHDLTYTRLCMYVPRNYFGDSALQMLVRQTLYHIGELTDEARPALRWRSDWREGGDMLDALHDVLARLADDLKQAPREYNTVGLLGEVAAFLSDWHAESRGLARSFAAMARRWAEEMEQGRLQEASSDEVALELRAKLCLLRETSLLCYGAGTLDAGDVREMVCLMVQIGHGQVIYIITNKPIVYALLNPKP